MKENSTTRQIKDYVAGAAFYVKKNLMGLTAESKTNNSAQNKQRPGSASQSGEDSTYGPFRAEMESEK